MKSFPEYIDYARALVLATEMKGILDGDVARARVLRNVNAADTNGIHRSIDNWRLMDAEAAQLKTEEVLDYLCAQVAKIK